VAGHRYLDTEPSVPTKTHPLLWAQLHDQATPAGNRPSRPSRADARQRPRRCTRRPEGSPWTTAMVTALPTDEIRAADDGQHGWAVFRSGRSHAFSAVVWQLAVGRLEGGWAATEPFRRRCRPGRSGTGSAVAMPRWRSPHFATHPWAPSGGPGQQGRRRMYGIRGTVGRGIRLRCDHPAGAATSSTGSSDDAVAHPPRTTGPVSPHSCGSSVIHRTRR